MPNTEPSANRPAPRVVVAGARGRLGRRFCEIAAQNRWPIQGTVRRRGTTPGGRSGPPAVAAEGIIPSVDPDGLAALLREADLYVSAVPGPVERELLPQVAEAGIPAVVAGTGLEASDAGWIARIADRIPFVWEPNFSIGMNWLAGRFLRGRLPPGFDRGIVEVHHRGKADRPSGSARSLAHALGPTDGDSPGTRRPAEPPAEVASLRIEGVAGVHQVWLTGAGEMIRIEHVVLDRDVFARGMFLAASALWEQADPTPGRRSLADLWPWLGGSP